MSVLTRRLGALAARLSSPLRRGYGSAAAQLDYDYYYSYDAEEETGPEPHRRGMEESDGWETPRRGVQWVIMGDPLVRRHVYAQRLSKLLDVPHISMGSLVRQELNPNSPLYKMVPSLSLLFSPLYLSIEAVFLILMVFGVELDCKRSESRKISSRRCDIWAFIEKARGRVLQR